MTAPEPLSSSEARRIATTLLAQLVNVRSDHPMYVGLATAALAYATLAPQLGPSQEGSARCLSCGYRVGGVVAAHRDSIALEEHQAGINGRCPGSGMSQVWP